MRKTPVRRLMPLLLAAALMGCASAAALVGCASGPPAEPPGGGRHDGERSGPRSRARAPNVFISPSGRPYRAEPGAPYPSAAWFEAADLDHDGRLTRAEFLKDAEAFFRELDADHNGVIDGFELQRYENEVAPEINPQVEGLHFGEGMDLSLGRDTSDGGRRMRPEIGGGEQPQGRAIAADRQPQGAGLFSFLNEPEPVAACDLKVDSHITLAEFLTVNGRRFDTLDRLKQGYLTLAALPKTPAQIALERAQPKGAGGDPPVGLGPRRGGPR